MSGLARELDVKVPSLYNHVPNLEGSRREESDPDPDRARSRLPVLPMA